MLEALNSDNQALTVALNNKALTPRASTLP